MKEKEKKEIEQNISVEPEVGKPSFFSRIKKRYESRQEKRLKKFKPEQLSDEENKKVEEKIEEATKETSKPAGKNKKIRSIVFFIFNIILVAGILIWNFLDNGDVPPLSFLELRLEYLVYTLLLLAGVVLADVMSVHRMIYRKTMRSRWHLSYKSSAVLRYYDAITPLASGGQAFMVTYLTSRDVPGSTALSIPISKLLFQNIAWIIVTFVCLVLSFSSGMNTLVSASSIIGFILAILMVVFILVMSLSKKFGLKLVTWGLKLLVKLHILKNYDKMYAKVVGFVEDYQSIMKEYSHAKFDVLYQLILHGLRNVCIFSMPFLIYQMFPVQSAVGIPIGTYGKFFIFTAMIDLASSFIPLPGGTGMNEITFTALFRTYLGQNTFWALLIWRFCSYYFYLLQGIGLLSYDTLYGNRKYRWVKTKRALQQESRDFRQEQIEIFRRERNKRRKKQAKAG